MTMATNSWPTPGMPPSQQAIANRWIADPVSGSASRPTGAIYSGVPGMCLDDFGDSGTADTKADVYGCNPTPAQQWNMNNGSIAINGLCLDIVGGGTSNGTLVDVWHCTSAANQIWTVQNGTLANPASGRCLDDPGGSTSNGTQLDLKDCDGSPGQQWRVPSEGSVISGIAGKCLDAFGGSTADRAKVDSFGCNPTSAQQWIVTNNTLNFDGKCLDITGGSTANGALMELYLHWRRQPGMDAGQWRLGQSGFGPLPRHPGQQRHRRCSARYFGLHRR
ncbi:MAG TPA: RICIN domain-containing protein [Edaphobacter sp.]|nr:RICIN domain-containing protein [Edaphobacter sp.]